MKLTIPETLVRNCREPSERAWLEGLAACVEGVAERWSLDLYEPYPSATCAWVAPVTLADHSPAVLKVGMPHMEAEDEIPGLRFWRGESMVRLIDADAGSNAMLLEACQSGTPLRSLSEPEQDVVVAKLLLALWRVPPPGAFRPLSDMLRYWADFTLADAPRWPDTGVVRAGLELFQDLPRTANHSVLLLTDLHAGNILRAKREPWLAIDPKPFVGDPAYDATQHLFNCQERMIAEPDGTIKRFADRLGVSSERVRLWFFARLAAEPRDDWTPRRWDRVLAALSP